MPVCSPVTIVVASLALAQIPVRPRVVTLRAGQICAFQVRWPEDRERNPHWRWWVADATTGAIDGETGVFTAPPTETPLTARVRVAPVPDDGRRGEAVVTVLPNMPFDLVEAVLGPEWLEPYRQDLPFWDLEADRRFPGRSRVVGDLRPELPGAARVVGYGLPCALPCQEPTGAYARLLSYREGGQTVRREVTGPSSPMLTPRGKIQGCMVENLVTDPDQPDRWFSRFQAFNLRVRGLVSFAGNPTAPGGHQDGDALSARFLEPAGMAWVGGPPWALLVADSGSHCLRKVDSKGAVTTFCGEPGVPGHRDTPRDLLSRLKSLWQPERVPGARFNGPAFLAARRGQGWFQSTWEAAVADSGNQVIRKVDQDGMTTTLAGCAGLAGHRDAQDPREALFSNPQGLAWGKDGQLYVADQGNRVIRRICAGGSCTPWGVSTLAGSPGEAGVRDGVGAQARFTDLKDLLLAHTPDGRSILLVLDGHAVRQIDPETGAVETLLGAVAAPGFLDLDPVEPKADAALQPCLRDPTGLFGHLEDLYIADQGNHAVRRANVRIGSLTTWVGGPGQGEHRMGLLRDGLRVPLDSSYAALAAPRALIEGPDGRCESLVVASGTCLWDLRRAGVGPGTFRSTLSVPEKVSRHELFPIGLAFGPSSTFRSCRYTLDFMEADGTLGQRVQGRMDGDTVTSVQGRFAARGSAELVLRCVNSAGISFGASARVEVQ